MTKIFELPIKKNYTDEVGSSEKSSEITTPASTPSSTEKIPDPTTTPSDEPKFVPYMVLSESDRETLVKLIYLESGIESIDCKIGVVSVIINRLNNGYWGDTIDDVVYAKSQFSPASMISSTVPYVCDNKNYQNSKEFIGMWDDCYSAVDHVLNYGPVFPQYVMYFRAGYHFNWSGYVPYCNIDNTYFGYLSKDYKE